MMRGAEVMGAVHLYREAGQFEQMHFDFAISASAMLSTALLATRNRASERAEHKRLADRNADSTDMLGQCQPMQVLKDRIKRVAAASGCVLVRGESGVGKEMVAEPSSQQSPQRSTAPVCQLCSHPG